MTNNRLFLDIHAIQSVPPSNINRDDTGSPKTAEYGGARRARVSSQSWKRAMRRYFNENSEQANLGKRTVEIVQFVSDKIREIDPTIDFERSMEMAEEVVSNAGIKTKNQKTKALFFIGNEQGRKLAEAAINNIDDKKILTEILKDNPAIDIALFGRMVATDASLNEDASSQVAHAISTHAVQTEFDFYTAVDDLRPDDKAGAGMLGTIEYNSSTLYRYANVSVHELLNQLKDKESVINTLTLFVEAFTNSMPKGYVNSFANQTLPKAVLVILRNDRPVNLVGAFEKPIRSKEGYVNKSIERMFRENKKVEKFVNQPVKAFYLKIEDNGFDETGLSIVDSIAEMKEMLELELKNIIPELGD
ncbi:type I-E CRISPR-associated protein Cas7/Cse4/CasC [Tuanshanicoccus lijuaniae]|uniref:type I-E CRISPR-associated protein Cas7/Cse4/CasC n=1 Tax=Aerococcaceae bacterium zg-1292 TaxID=2774330 RepID=UPI001938355D|nr:type I-E CRISPR-associated protein Cas7/Cse4/CasC [Aerococcaceae bacterium zg-1292]QQA36600.1 type I-E CRISPR-associated protein Cas7/Cse4/CasC [Aerococcaceae bacterium zg-1292]